MIQFTKRGFTLIEMLVVVIILGVILAIAIPSISNLINNNRNRMYDVYMKVVEEQTKLFIDQHKGELMNINATCYQVNYQTLLDQDLLTEGDVHCNGNIIITKSGNGKNFESEYYLNCADKNNDSIYQSEDMPTGCTLFTGR